MNASAHRRTFQTPAAQSEERRNLSLESTATEATVDEGAMVDEGWTTVEKKAPKETTASGRGGGIGNGKERSRVAGASRHEPSSLEGMMGRWRA